jgi:VWFA-related protein
MRSGEPAGLRLPIRTFLSLALFTALALAQTPSAQTPAAQAPSGAATPPASEQGGVAIFSSDARYVPLNVTVTDKNDKLVTNLTESAFQVLENGVPQPIKVFKHEDVPVSMGLVIDNSGSMRLRRSGVESSALTLVKDSNPDDETFVVNFNDEPFLDQDFTGDIAQLQKGLDRIDAKGGTAMRDAIRVSIDHLHDKAKHDKKVIVVVTDGNDNASMVTLESLTRLAQQDGTLIYAIGLLADEDKSEANKARKALKTLVDATGGLVFYPKEVSEVEPIAHEVAHDIRNQYSIWYAPLNDKLDNTYRQIKVTVKAPGNPVARTRAGYYATDSRRPNGSKNPQ